MKTIYGSSVQDFMNSLELPLKALRGNAWHVRADIKLSWGFCFLELSQAVVDAGAVPLLVLCIQEPELSLKRIAASGLSDICKHSPEVICMKSCCC